MDVDHWILVKYTLDSRLSWVLHIQNSCQSFNSNDQLRKSKQRCPSMRRQATRRLLTHVLAATRANIPIHSWRVRVRATNINKRWSRKRKFEDRVSKKQHWPDFTYVQFKVGVRGYNARCMPRMFLALPKPEGQNSYWNWKLEPRSPNFFTVNRGRSFLSNVSVCCNG